MVLEHVNSPQDLKLLTEADLETLAAELRTEIIRICSRGGLHLASSLGTVELTVALHRVFDSPTDRILWDVGHQAYGHKILTGRKNRMDSLKREGGLSGFTKITESEHDAITVGHASTSLANALGMCLARDARGEHYHIVPVIGDGALTGGMALAALNIIGDRQPRMTIILNDNDMSISPNVGAMNATFRNLQVQKWFQSAEEGGKKFVRRFSRPLEALLTRAKDATRTFFDPHSRNPFAAMNIRYVGPVDGHDVRLLTYLLEHIKQLEGPTILHVVTKKGKGLSVAEGDPTYWHSPAKFDPLDPESAGTGSYSWSNAFGDAMTELADDDPRVFVITPAMKEGSGLVEFAAKHGNRFIDVGIAEDVAVTTGAGMALRGMKPVVAVYSTFLQRAFDQVIHDVSIENLDVTFAVDRAGVVGPDGPTHNGAFDLSYLRLIPNLTIAAPRNAPELRAMLRGAIERGGPIAIRYPRGAVAKVNPGVWQTLEWGSWERLRPGAQVCILAVGRTVEYALAAAESVEGVGVINARFVKPLDEAMLLQVARNARAIVTVEDNTVRGGFGSAILEWLAEHDFKIPVRVLGLPDRFLEHAEIGSLHARAGIDAEGIKRVLEELGVRPAMLAVGD